MFAETLGLLPTCDRAYTKKPNSLNKACSAKVIIYFKPSAQMDEVHGDQEKFLSVVEVSVLHTASHISLNQTVYENLGYPSSY
jgi:hypothetical protein